MIRIARILLSAAGTTALVASASAQIGTPYCTANPNSTGQASVISASGSTNVNLNDLTLTAQQVPPFQFCLFVTSPLQGFVASPNGSSGNLCLGGQIGRYQGSILNSGASGTVSLPIDLTAIPTPNTLYSVMPGMTVNFQLWHRDIPNTSNFSPGLEVTFDVGPSLSFQTDIHPMFVQANINASSCVTCHGSICGLDLSTPLTAYNNLINVQSTCCFPDLYVVPGDSASSVLWQKLGLPGPACGSTMPLGGDFAGDANMIADWIDSGAPF